MKELVEVIAKALVDNPDEVVVTETEKESGTFIELKVAPSDMGKVIGKQGRIAKAIRNMFLLESGFIGFMGGVVGLAFSEAVSFAINHLLNIGQSMTGMSGNISRIPLWLAAASLAFAVFIGMAAGFFPALRAMKLSPLAAIRNE